MCGCGTSELFQIGNAALYAWMCAEEVAHHIGELAGKGFRTDDEELCHVFTINAAESRIVADFAQCGSQS